MANVTGKELITEGNDGLGKLVRKHRKLGPAISGLASATLAEGNLSVKTKELIAVAISVHTRCDYCIAHHVKGCLDAGATEEEIAEACGVAVLMGGGPAVMYSGLAIKIVEELKKSGTANI